MIKTLLITTAFIVTATTAQACSYYYTGDCKYEQQDEINRAKLDAEIEHDKMEIEMNSQRSMAEHDMEQQRYDMEAQRRQAVLDADDYPIMGTRE